ncbi:hypothetical protein [Tritonibacter mobilis]|uniref:hypothetical protein n=1 Tax=Tritonibacter mobilis TaxID=379347 RepID=UPI000806CF6D|nr:hypothetical protein [Tritonibacter mobilis]
MSNLAEHQSEQAALTARYEALTAIGRLAHDLGASIETSENVDEALAYCAARQERMDAVQLRTLDEARADANEDAAETSVAWHTPVQVDDTDNSTRAARVLQAIYPAYDDDTAETAVRDVLTDLRHLCDLMGWDFADLDRDAHETYFRELSECGGVAVNPDLKAAIELELQ